MKLIKTLNWQDPLELANHIAQQAEHVAFLYSGAKHSYSGDQSFLAWDAVEVCDNYVELASKTTEDQNIYENIWFGYFGYELKDEFIQKSLKTQHKSLNLPKTLFFRPKNLLVFQHEEQEINFYSVDNKVLDLQPAALATEKPVLSNLASNMTKSEYLDKVRAIRSDIIAGNYYQANLTRKFFGDIESQNNFSIYADLTVKSPAPYSSYLRLGNFEILSSSPERFLHIDNSGLVNTRPIKGTIDKTARDSLRSLKESSKDRAENLMIVDLMRNDLSITAKANSVKTDSLFDIDSFSTLHHMSSSISARKDVSSLEVIKEAFPPGSMTGAPKIAAMNAIAKLEDYERGIYSGAIGYLGGDGSVDLSVVIRTIIIQKNKFEFQVGGGIIYDSDPEKEWLETLTKAKAICNTMGISIDEIATI